MLRTWGAPQNLMGGGLSQNKGGAWALQNLMEGAFVNTWGEHGGGL